MAARSLPRACCWEPLLARQPEALAFAAWRGGALRGLTTRTPTQLLLSRSPVLDSLSRCFGRGGRTASQYGTDVLRDIAQRTRTPVQDISSRLRLPIGTTYAVVADLERQGLVRSTQSPRMQGLLPFLGPVSATWGLSRSMCLAKHPGTD
jgi:hypothetical protein